MFSLFIKRLFDIVSSTVAVILLFPFGLIVAVAIKLDSKGPVFFAQDRRTKNGKIFKMLKFRSMVTDAEKQGTGLFSYDNDPRPCVSYELGDFDTLNKKYKKRFQVKGGITGLAQVKGRNENSWDEKVTLDNQYVDLFAKEGFWLDIKIMWWTVFKVFAKKNINESKISEDMSDIESAELSDEEVKRIAHLPD